MPLTADLLKEHFEREGYTLEHNARFDGKDGASHKLPWVLAKGEQRIGLDIVLKRRRLFRAYLREIDHALAASGSDAPVLARRLEEIRARVRRDLLWGRLPTDHYGVVTIHLDRERAMARLGILQTGFAEVPLGLAQDVLRFLRDGVLSVDDRNRLVATLEASKVPLVTRRQVAAQLDAWVTEDRKVGA